MSASRPIDQDSNEPEGSNRDTSAASTVGHSSESVDLQGVLGHAAKSASGEVEFDLKVADESDRKPIPLEKLFRDYLLDGAYDEMRMPDGSIRPHYQALVETLANLPHDELLRRKQSADLSFLTQGI